MKRRTLLAAGGSATLLAGCLDDERNNDDGNPGSGDEDTVSGSIETAGSDCASPNDDWAFAIDEGETIRIDGTTPAPNPCHRATLEDAALEESELQLVVDVESTLGVDEDCPECAGAVAYTATVDIDDVDVTAVEIDHDIAETHELDLFSPNDSTSVQSTAIETTGTDCGVTDTADVEMAGRAVNIRGTITASNPCHSATIDSAEVQHDMLHLDIAAVPDADVDACIECIGEISYRALIELDGLPVLTDVRIDHHEGDTHSLEISRFD